MEKIGKLTLFVVLFAFIVSFASLAKTVPPPPDYFPLAVGYWWQYKVVEKNMEFTIKVTDTEKIGEVTCYKVETLIGDKVSFVDYYAKHDGFVWIYKTVYPASNMECIYEPTAKKYLQNPMAVNDKWEWAGKGMMGVEIESKDSVIKTEGVEVPAGKFSTMNVESKIKQGGMDVLKKYWYAPNIGLVKSYTNSSGIESNAVLVKYNLKPAK